MKLIKKAALYGLMFVLLTAVFGGVTAMALLFLKNGGGPFFAPSVWLSVQTWLYGAIEAAIVVLLYLLFQNNTAKKSKRILKGKAERIEGALENSRFMTDEEKDENFPKKHFKKLAEEKKDGIALYAVYNSKKKDVDINLSAPAHGLIIGATGSGKTTTFINPVIQILGHTSAGSSIICTDPKGELFQLHSGFLERAGYKVMVLDLRDPYSSFRWNPLGDIYDRYQRHLHYGDDIFEHRDSAPESGLVLRDAPEAYGEVWYEFEGKAYSEARVLINYIRVEKQKIYDELYEDLNDLISVICPIESQDDPVWEKGARSIIMATCLAMLEDSANPELEMTKEKFCFYNINKAISNSENEFAALKDYFRGRDKLSKAVGLSRQVLSAADQTLASYMSIAFDKLSMFNDEGLCALTSATDIRPEQIANEKTALFLKIPDEKDTRHALAAVFILCIYKALIKVASASESLSLPRNVYFLLDEFGNMPRIDKFDKMITVGRSRKIWFHMVVQSYSQLNNVYGDTIADIIKSNCGIKMFIGSNDIATCEEFSKLCGNMSVATTSVSGSTSDTSGQINYSSQIQDRPLIYPSELMKLNNKKDTGNAIIVTFGNYPLRTKFTPSYKCPLYEMGQMDLTVLDNNVFFGEDVFYDLDERNYLVLDQPDESAEAAKAGGGMTETGPQEHEAAALSAPG
ncbi:MAG: type IV secretory system conjugative DNA transfer family protein [Eubacteriales bacterium]|nr:type IV secretory system conjugative DNA transfer family protein [Eubacteriales bacterium]